MKKLLLLFFHFPQLLLLSGQNYFPPNNLVINPLFNEYTLHIVPHSWEVCQFPSMQCGYLNSNTNMFHVLCLNDWISPNIANPDFMYNDSCNIWHFPDFINNEGIARINIFSEFPDSIYTFHEYIQGILSNILQKDNKYCIAINLLFDNYSTLGTVYHGANNIFISSVGVYLSNAQIYGSTTQAFYEYYPPQIQNPLDRFLSDSTSWMLVSGSFIAVGGEKHITIGNFLPDTLTPYIEFKENNTVYASGALYFIGFVGVYDCTGHDFTCNAGENMRLCSGEVVQLGTDEDNRRQYHWSPGKGLSDSTAARPLAAPTETTTYYLYVIDEFLQQSYDTITVEVVNCDIFIPNIFSPNNDGLNDVLYVRGEGIAQLSFVIFNRWGEKVFETNDPHHGWDGTFKGKPAETGVYVFMVEGKLENGQTVKRSGNVTLVR